MKQTIHCVVVKPLKVLTASVLTFLLVITLIHATPTPASAVDARDFNPGNIITDENFYDGASMTATEIQRFLDSSLNGGKCTIGQADRKPGDPAYWGGPTTFASSCLNGYRETTTSESANAYCKAYHGASNETAAQIIAKVGNACGVSQKVLLVLLEKEQSLVTDEWPTVKQFNRATGYACPDSGPNNTAYCDTTYYGFFNQLYSAAWQFKYYKANPARYRYKAKQTNTIQWHPNASCGTSQVYIENDATAGLYIYTPYRPNQAALNAQWGAGNNCSSYGNRNFFMFYSQWFGSPNGFQVASEMQQFYSSQGGAGGEYGVPTASAVRTSTYVAQEFSGGTLYWSAASGASSVNGAIRNLYNAEGGPTSYLGLPVGAEQRNNGISRQEFQNGTAYWSSPTGASVINGAIRAKYFQLGDTKSSLGLPIGPEIRRNGESIQEFQHGTLLWTSTRGVTFKQ